MIGSSDYGQWTTVNGKASRHRAFAFPSPDAVQNAPSCVKLKPGKVTPSADFVTFTFTTGASGALTWAGRNTAYWLNTSL